MNAFYSHLENMMERRHDPIRIAEEAEREDGRLERAASHVEGAVLGKLKIYCRNGMPLDAANEVASEFIEQDIKELVRIACTHDRKAMADKLEELVGNAVRIVAKHSAQVV